MRIAPTWFLGRGLWGGGSSLRGGGQIGVPEIFLMIRRADKVHSRMLIFCRAWAWPIYSSKRTRLIESTGRPSKRLRTNIIAARRTKLRLNIVKWGELFAHRSVSGYHYYPCWDYELRIESTMHCRIFLRNRLLDRRINSKFSLDRPTLATSTYLLSEESFRSR